MKNKWAIFLIILFLIVAALGVAGISAMSDAEPTSRQALNSGSRGDSVADCASGDLLSVRIPDSIRSQQKDYEGFRVSFNYDNHTPNWVAWELLARETDGSNSRYNKFWMDEEVEGCPQTSDYTRSGFDRGHMCPAADQKWSDKAMVDCFSLANIVPQDNALNTGAWKTLENKERQWAQRDSAIVIVAGPIYTGRDRQRIGAAGVRVPGAFFKVMIAPYLPEPRGIAFVYPNMTSPGNMENYVMTIRDVEKLTGYDFFHNLPDDIEDKVETVASFKDWNKR